MDEKKTVSLGVGQDQGNEKQAGGPNVAPGPVAGNACDPPQTATPGALAAKKHQDIFAATKTTRIWQVARLLLAGKPVPKRAVAEQLGLDPGEVDATLQQLGPGVEYDDSGDLVSFTISLTPTPHHYTVDGVPLYVWCAGDALGFPALFGHTADVETTDPVTGEKVRARVGPKGIEWVSHKAARLSLPTNPAGLGEDVRGLTCANIHLFASEESAKQWTAERPGTTIIDLDQLKTLFKEVFESGAVPSFANGSRPTTETNPSPGTPRRGETEVKRREV